MRLLPRLVAIAATVTVAACGPAKDQTASNPADAGSTQAAAPALDSPQNKKLAAELGAAYANADLSNGQTRFALCRSCHTITKGGPNMTGPNLYGLFGRKAGSVADYA